MANGFQARDIASAATIRTIHSTSVRNSHRRAFEKEMEGDEDNLKIDFINDTTLHGLRNACKKGSNILRRALWIAVILGMTVGCIVMIAQSIVKYLRFDSVTSTSKLLNSTLSLPAITVCNINFYKASVIIQKYPIVYMYQVLQNKGLDNLTPEELFQMEEIEEQMRDIGLKSFIDDVAQTPDEMFVNCHFAYSTAASKPCSEYLTPLYNTRGKCYTFHSKDYIAEHDTVDVIQPGPTYGVTMTLDTMKEEYYYTFGLGYGLQVLVHDPSVYPLMEQKSFVVSPGRETYVALQKFITKRLPKPFSEVDCVDTSLPGNDDYSQDRCFLDCMAKLYYNNRCTHNTYADITCTLYDVYAVMYDHYLGDLAGNCQCLPTCTEIYYQYRLSTTEFPNIFASVHALQYNWTSTNMTYVKNNYAHLMIYFDTMEYVTNEQMKSITLEQIVADIGGQLGICLGASLITVAELLDYGLIGMFLLYRKCTRRNTTRIIEVKPNHQLY